MEDVVKFVALKLLGSSGPGGTDSESLQGWLLKFGEDSKKIRISAEIFFDLPANKNPPWAAYSTFMSDWMIAPDKQPVGCTAGIGETWRRLFSKCVLKVTGLKDTNTCQDDQISTRFKAEIDK